MAERAGVFTAPHPADILFPFGALPRRNSQQPACDLLWRTLEHFAGDGIMVFINDPVTVDDHELAAIRLALAAQERFAELARVWRKRGTQLGLGIGIEAGYATLGRIGFEGRYDYGALGPVTNLASRLSSDAAAGQILIGPRLFAAVEGTVDTDLVGDLDLKGFSRPISAYEVRGLRIDREIDP